MGTLTLPNVDFANLVCASCQNSTFEPRIVHLEQDCPLLINSSLRSSLGSQISFFGKNSLASPDMIVLTTGDFITSTTEGEGGYVFTPVCLSVPYHQLRVMMQAYRHPTNNYKISIAERSHWKKSQFVQNIEK